MKFKVSEKFIHFPVFTAFGINLSAAVLIFCMRTVFLYRKDKPIFSQYDSDIPFAALFALFSYAFTEFNKSQSPMMHKHEIVELLKAFAKDPIQTDESLTDAEYAQLQAVDTLHVFNCAISRDMMTTPVKVCLKHKGQTYTHYYNKKELQEFVKKQYSNLFIPHGEEVASQFIFRLVALTDPELITSFKLKPTAALHNPLNQLNFLDADSICIETATEVLTSMREQLGPLNALRR